MEARYIFIGDVHGCYEELVELMDRVEPSADDVVVALGDFLDRGPSPDKCLEYWISKGYLAVLGNHDERFLSWKAGNHVSFAEGFEAVIDLMGHRSDLIEYLGSLPYFLTFDEIDAIAVHAAIDVNQSSFLGEESENAKNIYLRGRHVRQVADGEFVYLELGKHGETDQLWCEHWSGSTRVFYGHTPFLSGVPKITENSVGLDTGAVYGHKLSAAIVDTAGIIDIVSVNAKNKYWKIAKPAEIVKI